MASEAQIQTMLDLMGQQMLQLTALQQENAQLRAGRGAKGKTKTPDRPSIHASIDEREWESFKDTWQRYKTMTSLTDADSIRMELRAACSPDVNKLLFEFIGSTTLNTASEQQLMTHIRAVAVKGTHKEVHRMNFAKLTQMEGETITQFVARLKSQAALCQFNVTCSAHTPPTPISYADEMVTQQLIAGLRNQQHQSRVLAEASTLTTLAAKIERLQCLESTEESTSQMRMAPDPLPLPTSAAALRQSQYRHAQKGPHQPPSTSPKKCRGCGRPSHPGKSMTRRDCPAFNKTCSSCGIKGHFQAVCEKRRNREEIGVPCSGRVRGRIPV